MAPTESTPSYSAGFIYEEKEDYRVVLFIVVAARLAFTQYNLTRPAEVVVAAGGSGVRQVELYLCSEELGEDVTERCSTVF